MDSSDEESVQTRNLRKNELIAMIRSDKHAIRLARTLQEQRNDECSRLTIVFDWVLEVNEESAQVLALAIANSQFAKLELRWRFFATEHDVILAKYLLEAVGQSATIQELAINTDGGDNFGLVVDCLPKLRRLELRRWFDSVDIRQLSEALPTNSSITHLVLHKVDASAAAVRTLSQALSHNSSMRTLTLYKCEVSDDSVKALLETWHHRSQIESLELPSNHIGPTGAMLLIQTASTHPYLQKLNLKGNKKIGFEGLASIALELPDVVMSNLNLSLCVERENLDESGFEEKSQLVFGLLAEGMRANRHIGSFESYNMGANEPATELRFYARRNRYRPLIWSLGTPTFWCYIFEKFQRDQNFIFFFLKEQPRMWPERDSSVSRPQKRLRES
jgi:hypothetical protein